MCNTKKLDGLLKYLKKSECIMVAKIHYHSYFVPSDYQPPDAISYG